ncbi:alpha/beta hydrolase [Nocardia sp. NBC_01503]|uniref:alpha/beta fold hydrolase n=1 Tax=Nocardia sp. NBC_01503 TaxID=2975997 RepID=UPI002E7C0FF6|nr:alpha/beta hydrolase [Nocardia sp. NBC_01503]WTL31139.1 alpha/beta hydrolase [Nocardia sp. NBC_01503]
MPFIESHDFRAELPSIDLPTLIIHGDTDASVTAEMSARVLASLLPNSTLAIHENAPHGLYLTHGARLTADLLDFVAKNAED